MEKLKARLSDVSSQTSESGLYLLIVSFFDCELAAITLTYLQLLF